MPKKGKGKGFFALDVHQFECIRKSGLGVEEAATYLSLLKSTDQSNAVSCGGVRSIMAYSGLSRAEAKRAIANLERVGLTECLEVARKRARNAERYNLPIHDCRRSLSVKERGVVDAIKVGQQPEGQSEIQAAHRAATKGWIEKRSSGWQLLEHSNTVAFIPNSFVRVTEGQSPLYRLVNAGELGPFMLAAELYQLQNLMDERGVPPSIVRGYFHSTESHQLGRHRLHFFDFGRSYTDEDGAEQSFDRACNLDSLLDKSFWQNLRALDAAHVVEWAVYSANGKPNGKYAFNRPQRPLGVLRNGRQVLTTPESRPAFMTYLVAQMREHGGQITHSLPQLIEEWRSESPIIALENASVSHVEGISILRLTHRAATENAKVWWRDLCQECDEAFFFVENAARSLIPQLSDIAEEIQSFPDFEGAISMKLNESSMIAQCEIN